MLAKKQNTDLGKWRASSLHWYYTNSLVYFKVQDKNFPRVQQNEMMSAGLVVGQLQTFIQSNCIFVLCPK